MRRILLASSLLGLVLVGCGELHKGSANQARIDSTDQKEAEQRIVKTGSEFVIKLEENGTTGYKWYVAKIDNTILKLKSRQFIPPTSSAMGAPGQVELKFSALSEGETTLVLELKRSPDSTPAETKVFKVISRNKIVSEDSRDIKCEPAAGLVGNVASVTGTMNLSNHPLYPDTRAKLAKGELKLVIGGLTLQPVLQLNTEFAGQYDSVGGEEYITAGDPLNSEILVYMNLTRKNESYAEYKGTRYDMNCAR